MNLQETHKWFWQSNSGNASQTLDDNNVVNIHIIFTESTGWLQTEVGYWWVWASGCREAPRTGGRSVQKIRWTSGETISTQSQRFYGESELVLEEGMVIINDRSLLFLFLNALCLAASPDGSNLSSMYQSVNWNVACLISLLTCNVASYFPNNGGFDTYGNMTSFLLLLFTFIFSNLQKLSW